MPYEISPDEMEAAINLSMISPIPIVPKRSAADHLNASALAAAAPSHHTQTLSRWISPSDQERQLLRSLGSDKVLISEQNRNDMSRNVYIILRSNLPESIQPTTTSPQLILISRAIEKKLYERAESYQSYLDLSTLKFRLTALACAILIYSEEYGEKEGNSGGRSETCTRLLTAARNSLSHSVMVLVSFESQKLGLER